MTAIRFRLQKGQMNVLICARVPVVHRPLCTTDVDIYICGMNEEIKTCQTVCQVFQGGGDRD